MKTLVQQFPWWMAVTCATALVIVLNKYRALDQRAAELEKRCVELGRREGSRSNGAAVSERAEESHSSERLQGPNDRKVAQEVLRANIIEKLSRLKGDWRHAFSVASELSKLDCEVVLEVLRGSWQTITSQIDRQQILKAFHLNKNPKILDILDLGITDTDPDVRGWAANFLQFYAFKDFAASGDYAAWRARFAGTSVESVVGANAKEFIDSLMGGAASDIDRVAKSLRKYAFSADAAQALVAGGLPSVLEKWLAMGSSGAIKSALGVASKYPLDENAQRGLILPILQTPDFRVEAIGALGHEGNRWAVDILASYLRSEDEVEMQVSAKAMADIGDRRAVPLMIDAIRAAQTQRSQYAIGHFGLQTLTGVVYDDKHDAAWWSQWWQENQSRFQGDHK